MNRDGAERAVAESDEAALERAWEILTWWRRLYVDPLSQVTEDLQSHVIAAKATVSGRVEVTARLKRLATVIGKVERMRGGVAQMEDIGGVRAVVPGLEEVAAVRDLLLGSWPLVRERDYIARPKDDGYRAIHVIVRSSGLPIEVQIRTLSQDLWANLVEDYDRESGSSVKFGGGSEEARSEFASVADTLAAFDRGEALVEIVRAALIRLPHLVEESHERQ
jgi:putative GTP pyrophosphokinase